MSRQAGNGEGQHPATGRVVAGACELEVGAPGGSRLVLIEPSAQQSTQGLADALGPLGSELRAPTDFLKGVVDKGSEAADAVDHSVALLTAAADGLADPATINVEIDTVLRALSYFDHEHRYEDEIELARTLANLLALLERWWELVQTLLHAFEGAKHLATSGAKDHAQGWVLHELGSLSTCADRPSRASELLNDAKKARERINDHQGLAATNQNLALTGTRLMPVPPRPSWRPSGRQWCGVGAGAAILAGVASGAVIEHQVGNSPSPTPAITLVVKRYGPTSIRYTGTADTRSIYNRFVIVRVFPISSSGPSTPIKTSLHRPVSSDGTFEGSMAYASSLQAGIYYAQASQGWGNGEGHALSARVPLPIAAVSPPPTQGTSRPTLKIDTPADRSRVRGTPIRFRGTATNLSGLYVEVVICSGSQVGGPEQETISPVPIKANGFWTATTTATYVPKATYTAAAIITDANGTAPADAIKSRSTTFVWNQARSDGGVPGT